MPSFVPYGVRIYSACPLERLGGVPGSADFSNLKMAAGFHVDQAGEGELQRRSVSPCHDPLKGWLNMRNARQDSERYEPHFKSLGRGTRNLIWILILGVGSGISLGLVDDGSRNDRNADAAITTDLKNTREDATKVVDLTEPPLAGKTIPELRNESGPITTIGWTDADCNNCHQPEKTLSHPVGVVPTATIPASFPLVAGKIECITCHASESSSDHADARTEHTSLLRGTQSGANFCTNCHQKTSSTRFEMHASAAGKAHQGWSTTSRARTFESTESTDQSIARQFAVNEGQSCVTCHDNVIASAALHSSTRSSSGFDSTGRSMGHPVAVAYSDGGRGKGANSTLRGAGLLDQRIRLFDGKVECATCHNLYSQEKSLLVMSNRGSQLCASCHDM